MGKNRGNPEIMLSSLLAGMPGLTPAWGGVMAEAASVCLEDQGHEISVPLRVTGGFVGTFDLSRLQVDAQMRNAHRHEDTATENGAYGVAILTVRSLTSLTVLYQSRKGTGFDYWLGSEDSLLIQEAVRLEISGIRKGTPGSIQARAKEKVAQVQQSSGTTPAPAWIAIVEFSQPMLRISQP